MFTRKRKIRRLAIGCGVIGWSNRTTGSRSWAPLTWGRPTRLMPDGLQTIHGMVHQCKLTAHIWVCNQRYNSVAGEGTHIYMPPLHLLFVEMMIPTDTCEDHCIRTYSDSTEHTVDYYSSIQTYWSQWILMKIILTVPIRKVLNTQ